MILRIGINSRAGETSPTPPNVSKAMVNLIINTGKMQNFYSSYSMYNYQPTSGFFKL